MGGNSIAMPLLLNLEILYRIWDLDFQLARYKGRSFPKLMAHFNKPSSKKNLKHKEICCSVSNECLSLNKVSGFFDMYLISNRLFVKYNSSLNHLFQTRGQHPVADENISKC